MKIIHDVITPLAQVHSSTNFLPLHHSPKSIPQLLQHHLGQLPTSKSTRNIPITNRVRRQHNIIPSLRCRSRRRTHTDVRHVPRQHDFLPRIPQCLQILIELGISESRRFILRNHFLPLLGREFGKLLCQRGLGREDGCAVGGGVHDVHDVGAFVGGRAVFLEQRGDGAASGRDVDGFQETVGVSGGRNVSV